VWLAPILVSSCADGPSPCYVVVEDATNTHSTASRVTVAWRPPLAWLVLTNVYSVGGQYICMIALLTSDLPYTHLEILQYFYCLPLNMINITIHEISCLETTYYLKLLENKVTRGTMIHNLGVLMYCLFYIMIQ